MTQSPPWLEIIEGIAPLIVSIPHTGTEIPDDVEGGLVSPWLAKRDADWGVDKLYAFAGDLGATVIRTAISRTAIDVNRDPSGRSLYPGQATTGLCPTETFDGEALYTDGNAPGDVETGLRRERYFDPYHARLAHEIGRLRARHGKIVLYDAHSIRSVIPRLFEGKLPQFNIGTDSGAACGHALTEAIEKICAASGRSHITDGRFKGGYIARHYGDPANGVHAIQMELAIRCYMQEPEEPPSPGNWPPHYDAAFAQPVRGIVKRILEAAIRFASTP